eukprot:COSAG02_NODE_19804_length_864_cov_1.006536_1_plen_146_part_10
MQNITRKATSEQRKQRKLDIDDYVRQTLKQMPRTASHCSVAGSCGATAAKYVLDDLMNYFVLWRLTMKRVQPEFVKQAEEHPLYSTIDNRYTILECLSHKLCFRNSISLSCYLRPSLCESERRLRIFPVASKVCVSFAASENATVF